MEWYAAVKPVWKIQICLSVTEGKVVPQMHVIHPIHTVHTTSERKIFVASRELSSLFSCSNQGHLLVSCYGLPNDCSRGCTGQLPRRLRANRGETHWVRRANGLRVCGSSTATAPIRS